MKIAASLLAALLPLVAAGAAAQGANIPMKPPGSDSAAAMPLVEGEVRKVDPAKRQIVLRHGDLPNLAMPAMTMGYEVADRKMLDGLKVGDKVRFQAEMIKGKATVTELKR